MRIDGISGKLGAFEGPALDADTLERAVARIDAAADRMSTERLAELQRQVADIAGALSAGYGQDLHAAQDLAAMREDVKALRDEVTHNETLVAAIEPQIQQLVRSLVTDDRGAPDDAKLQRIEQQIAVIAGQFDATEDRLAGLVNIEAALGRIDAVVSARGQDVHEAAASPHRRKPFRAPMLPSKGCAAIWPVCLRPHRTTAAKPTPRWSGSRGF
ncbi:hypothetical protein [Breoghania sp.]|uniref:hypothetical protein n=1 Tax=Breoghania sp. TaxID=2065378 RepID=UPI002602845E|nr:hypothetical protein [Breoghania sp.]MDJ0932937.1 hypothetical protein [Breoghania sp.]